MYKCITLILVLLSTSAVADESKWYMGLGVGQSSPQLELDKQVAEAAINIPEELGGGNYVVPITIDSKFTSYGQKLFIGYDVGDKKQWAFELSYVNFGNYRATIDTDPIGTSGAITSEKYDINIPYSLYLTGGQKIKADLYATTFSMIYSFKLGERVSIFPRFGLSYLKGDIYIESKATISASIGDESGSLDWTQTDNESIAAILPMFGVGMDIDINDNHFIRTEFERYGHPTEQYVDMYTVTWGYKFN